MFKSETLFILGAGSSSPYGYPLGKNLIDEIINNIKKDSIYLLLPHELNGKYYFNENVGKVVDDKIQNAYVLDDFIQYLEAIDLLKFTQGQPQVPIGSNNQLLKIDGNHFVPAKLKQFKDFFDLATALEDFDPVSIDAFLRDHPAHTKAGKIMIVYSLLKHENITKFKKDQKQNDNWYSFLLNDLLSGCDNPDDITKNKLSIITFNYDLSLDYYIEKKLSEIGFLKDSKTAKQYISTLVSENIYHVYGKLYDEKPTEVYGNYYGDPTTRNYEKDNSKRFMKAVRSYRSIKSIYQERKKEEKYSTVINNSTEIKIIGFGFDRDNLDMLSFPFNEAQYGDFLRGKTLKYMDYKGQMNSLSYQFDRIKQKFKLSITRSTTDNITNAYQNDFKIYLY